MADTGREKPKKSKREKQVDTILKLLGDPVLFHDQHDTPYIRLEQSNAKITIPVKSRRFKTWLANLFYTKTDNVPNSDTIRDVIRVLRGKALFEGQEYTLYNRVAPADHGFWIDMCDDKWRAIRVTRDGWKI
nr:hypothetical protein [Candidatus Bathyarchaeota archaeon]NIW34075.1 hypothetical protein [Candidatus Bathyarchaeota archaeon]